MAFQDGQKKEEKKIGRQLFAKFQRVHWNTHLDQADASQQKRHHFDTCPTVMTSHPVHTAGGNRWFVSSAIYQGCFLKHLPPRQKMLWLKMNRWTHESGNKSEGGFFQMSPWQRHLPGRMRLYYLFYLWLQICECTNKWDLFSKLHLRVTVINIGHLWFYPVFQTRLGYQKCLLSGFTSHKECVHHKTLWNKTFDEV